MDASERRQREPGRRPEELPQAYLFDRPLRLLLVVCAVPALFLLAPRLLWILTNPNLPANHVRPSSSDALEALGLPPDQQPQCRNLVYSAPDPWQRTSPYAGKDPAQQEMKFCEDAKLIENRRTAIIACDPGRSRFNTVMGILREDEPRGALWTFDYSHGPSAEPRLVDVRGYPEDKSFHPLGMHVGRLPSGSYELFVVNHGKDSNSIEVLDLQAPDAEAVWTARYVRSITHPLATHSPNSVAVLEQTLLVTQDHLFPSRPPALHLREATYSALFGSAIGSLLAKAVGAPGVSMLLSKVETILGIPGGFVTAVDLGRPDGAAWVVARRIAFANGVVVSPAGSTVVVAETSAVKLRFYRPQVSADGTVTKLRQFDMLHMPMFPDNLDFSPAEGTTGQGSDDFDGATLTASGHPRPLSLLSFARDPFSKSKQSGTWSVSVEPAGGVPADQRGKLELRAWRRGQDPAPVPAAKRCMTQNVRWLIKTLYQAQKGLDDSTGVGVASGASALWDPAANGTLLVPGLYSNGVMACSLVGM